MTKASTNERFVETVLHKWLKMPHDLHVGIDKQPRSTKVTVVFVHGLADSHKMWSSIIKHVSLPNVRILAVDLLGFGDSAKPSWQSYSARIQARSLRVTLRSRHVHGPVIIVGHSLGSLVAVEYASLYPDNVSQLILCAPPFYKATTSKKLLKEPDDLYRRLYQYSRHRSEIAVKLADYIKRAKLINPSFTVDEPTLPAIISSLEMSIENQTALDDAERLRVPIHIVYGKLDPFIVKRNIRALASRIDHITVEAVVAGHEITRNKQFTQATLHAINTAILKHMKN